MLAGRPLDSSDLDSSEEENGGGQASQSEAKRPPVSTTTRATQTRGTMMEHLSAYAASCSLAIVQLAPLKNQFWDHMLACMKMPRGGVGGGGSLVPTMTA